MGRTCAQVLKSPVFVHIKHFVANCHGREDKQKAYQQNDSFALASDNLVHFSTVLGKATYNVKWLIKLPQNNPGPKCNLKLCLTS